METQAVVFDLGGVLVQLGAPERFDRLLGGSGTSPELRSKFVRSSWARRFECGLCTPEEFAQGLIAEINLSLDPDALLEAFLDWPQGLMSGAVDLVSGLLPHIRRVCLSNTNELHWQQQRDAPTIRALFHRCFASHEVGVAKPDAEIFRHVVGRLGLTAPEILFLDDSQANVDSARRVGLDAHCVLGVTEARRILSQRGLLVQD